MGNKVINTTSVKLGIYETSTDEQLAGMLGDVKEMEDGRKFRLCKNSTAGVLTPGVAVQGPAVDSTYDDGMAIGTASAGATTLTVTVNASAAADVAVNDYAGGWFCVNTGSDELGHGRKIKENTAAAKVADTNLTFYDKLTDDISSGSTGAWVKSQFNNVVKEAGTARCIGVPVCDVAASTSTVPVFFWAQVAGPCPMMASAAIVVGDNVQVVAGDVQPSTATTAASTEEIIGVAMQTIDTGDNQVGFIWLNIE